MTKGLCVDRLSNYSNCYLSMQTLLIHYYYSLLYTYAYRNFNTLLMMNLFLYVEIADKYVSHVCKAHVCIINTFSFHKFLYYYNVIYVLTECAFIYQHGIISFISMLLFILYFSYVCYILPYIFCTFLLFLCVCIIFR